MMVGVRGANFTLPYSEQGLPSESGLRRDAQTALTCFSAQGGVAVIARDDKQKGPGG